MSALKSDLIKQLIRRFEDELATLQKSADAAAEAATHIENKPENKYDTRSLEASYLAGAQRARAGDILAAIRLLETMRIPDFTDDDRVAATALVGVEDAGERAFFFLMTVGAGHRLNHGSYSVTVISPQSPIGRALVGKNVGDVAPVQTPQGQRDYEIVSIR